MFTLLFFAGLCASCLAQSAMVNYSYSLAVGGGAGTAFSCQGEGKITAVRVWENSNSYITGMQVRFDFIWSERVGRASGSVNEMELFEGEKFVQISGKYYIRNFVYQVIFVTSMGRSLVVGQPSQTSFNFYSHHRDAELIMLSGRYNGQGITSLGAHWGAASMPQSNSTDIST